jgi:hypothetical protein
MVSIVVYCVCYSELNSNSWDRREVRDCSPLSAYKLITGDDRNAPVHNLSAELWTGSSRDRTLGLAEL